MKKAIFILLSVLAVQTVYCQNDTIVTADTVKKAIPAEKKDKRPLKERIAFGFGTSFWINSSEFSIELAPVVAYRFPKRLISGVGYKYIYRHDRDFDQNLSAYGPNVFARVDLIKSIYFWTEYETLRSEHVTELLGNEFTTDKTTTDAWFVGLGWIRSVGKKGRSGLSIQVLYNVLYNNEDFSPYYGPVTYRVGFYF